MPAVSYNVATAGLSRVFLIEGRARPDHEPMYEGCMKAGSPDQSYGDIENIECPSPSAYGQFDKVGQVQGAETPATITLTNRYPVDEISDLLRLARLKCALDVQVHFGLCSDPSDFNTFNKAMIFEDGRFANWSAEDFGALASDENAKIDESTDLSAISMYEVLPLYMTERGQDVVVNPLEDVVICSHIECGDCDDEDDGCQIIFAVGDSGEGSPGTAPDLVWSNDRAGTLAADDINSLDASENADALACVGNYVVVVSNNSNSLHYKLAATITAGTLGGWTEVTADFEVGGEPNDIWSVGTRAFIVGDGGYVYRVTSNPAAGATVLDAGAATDQDLLAVHALDRNFVVAVGNSNSIIQATDGVSFNAVTGPAAGAGDNLTAVWLKDEYVWWIGNDAGEVYYTVDGGTTWTAFTNIPVTLTAVNDIAFSTDSVGYLAGVISGPVGVILRTYDGGYSWQTLPEAVGTLPDNDGVNAVAACVHDANFVVGVGLDGTDGYFVRGQD